MRQQVVVNAEQGYVVESEIDSEAEQLAEEAFLDDYPRFDKNSIEADSSKGGGAPDGETAVIVSGELWHTVDESDTDPVETAKHELRDEVPTSANFSRR